MPNQDELRASSVEISMNSHDVAGGVIGSVQKNINRHIAILEADKIKIPHSARRAIQDS